MRIGSWSPTGWGIVKSMLSVTWPAIFQSHHWGIHINPSLLPWGFSCRYYCMLGYYMDSTTMSPINMYLLGYIQIGRNSLRTGSIPPRHVEMTGREMHLLKPRSVSSGEYWSRIIICTLNFSILRSKLTSNMKHWPKPSNKNYYNLISLQGWI